MNIDKKTWYFFRYQELVIDDENLSAYDKATYGAISKYADTNTGICYPSLNTLAKKAGCSKPRLVKSIDNLIAAGYLIKSKRQNENGGNTSNKYKVVDLSYINNAVDYAKQKGDENLYNAIKRRLQKHPVPTYEQIFTLVNDINKGSKRDLQGVVNDINNPCKRGLHELELINNTNINKEDDDGETNKKLSTFFEMLFEDKPNQFQLNKLKSYDLPLKVILKTIEVAGLRNVKTPQLLFDNLDIMEDINMYDINKVEEFMQNTTKDKQSIKKLMEEIDKKRTP